MLQKSKNYNAIDLTKFIMAIFVVAIHTNPLYKCDNDIILTLYQCVVRCAVPFFFIASGFFISLKFNKHNSLEDTLQIIRKQLTKILKMYVVWSAIYLPLAVYGFITQGYTILNSILEYIKGFMLYGENYNSWMLWYLLSTIYTLIFVEILFRKNVSLNSICVIGASILLIGLSIDCLVNTENDLPGYLQLIKTIITKTIVNGRIFTGFFYIPLGMILARKFPNLITSILLLFFGFIGNFFFENIIGNIFLAICCTGLFCVIRYISLPNSPIFSILRQMSTIIYLIHMYIMTIFVLTAYGYMRKNFKIFIIVTFFSCLLSFIYIAINNLLKKYKTKIPTFQNT